MKFISIILLAVGVLVLVGGGYYLFTLRSQEKTEGLPVTPVPTSQTSLEGNNWTLIEYQTAAGQRQQVPAGMEVTVVFKNNQVSGKAACNNYNGSYSVSGQNLTFGLLSTTMMACPPAVMTVEAQYLQNMAAVKTYTIAGSTLTLHNTAGETILVYGAVAPSLGGTNWEVIGYNNGRGAVQSVKIGTRMTAVFNEDAISGSAGCNTYRGAYSVSGENIEIGPVSSTMMACEDPEVMQQEAAYLQALGKAATFNRTKTALELRDPDGALMVQYGKGE
jgi:heat shock protein HslJ